MGIKNNFESNQDNELIRIIADVASGTGVNKPVFIRLLKKINEDVDNHHFDTILSSISGNGPSAQGSDSNLGNLQMRGEIIQEEPTQNLLPVEEVNTILEDRNLIVLIEPKNEKLHQGVDKASESENIFVTEEEIISYNRTISNNRTNLVVLENDKDGVLLEGNPNIPLYQPENNVSTYFNINNAFQRNNNFPQFNKDKVFSHDVMYNSKKIESINAPDADQDDTNVSSSGSFDPNHLSPEITNKKTEYLDTSSTISDNCKEPESISNKKDINIRVLKRLNVDRSRTKTIIGTFEDVNYHKIPIENSSVNINLKNNDEFSDEKSVKSIKIDTIFLGSDKLEIKNAFEVNFENQIISKIVNHEGIRMESLNEVERENILNFCRNKIQKLSREPIKRPKGLFSRFFRFIMSYCTGEVIRIMPYQGEEIEISQFIFELGEYLLLNGIKTSGIFRCSAHRDFSKLYPFEIQSGKAYNPRNYHINDNAVLFKAYIREVLKGLFTIEISTNILRIYKEAKCKNKTDGKTDELIEIKRIIQLYLPFALEPKKYALLKLVYKLFSEINENKQKTEIDIRGLSIIFAPNIFPLDVFTDVHDYNIVPEIIELLYYGDIERVDNKVYQEYLEGKNCE